MNQNHVKNLIVFKRKSPTNIEPSRTTPLKISEIRSSGNHVHKN